MVVLHSREAPEAIAAWSGAPAPRFGDAGDVCRVEGCGTLLRRTNPMDTCERCQRRGHKAAPRRRDRAKNDRPLHDAPGFMEPARLPSREELEVAGDKRRKNGETKAGVLEYLRQRDDWCSCKEIAEALAVANGSASYHLGDLCEGGQVEKKHSDEGGGMWLWRIRQHEDGMHDDSPCPVSDPSCEGGEGDCHDACEPPTDVAPSPSAASAPVPEREQPASEAAADPAPDPQGPPPFAGIVAKPDAVTVHIHADTTRMRRGLDRVQGRDELSILRNLEDIDEAARNRVLTYAIDRWIVDWPDRKEA